MRFLEDGLRLGGSSSSIFSVHWHAALQSVNVQSKDISKEYVTVPSHSGDLFFPIPYLQHHTTIQLRKRGIRVGRTDAKDLWDGKVQDAKEERTHI